MAVRRIADPLKSLHETMARIVIRFAAVQDAPRLVSKSIITGPPPTGSTWEKRFSEWLGEARRGYRAVLVAQDSTGMLGLAQIVFKFPSDNADPEAANGRDTAMIDMIRVRPKAPMQLARELVNAIEQIAAKRGVKTLTFRIPLEHRSLITDARKWGFKEFRIMPDGAAQHVLFRKALP
jgi:hypothetical protein